MNNSSRSVTHESGAEPRRRIGLFGSVGNLGGPFIGAVQLSRALPPPPPVVPQLAFCVEECGAAKALMQINTETMAGDGKPARYSLIRAQSVSRRWSEWAAFGLYPSSAHIKKEVTLNLISSESGVQLTTWNGRRALLSIPQSEKTFLSVSSCFHLSLAVLLWFVFVTRICQKYVLGAH